MRPKATAEPPETLDGMTSTGIDYLALIQAEHAQATRRTINFSDLTGDDDGTEVSR